MPTRGEIAATFDAIAGEFAATRERPWPETIAFLDRLAAKSRILDLGCGNGRNLVAMREAGHAVVGLDASRGLLGFAAKVSLHRLVQGDAVALPFHDHAFDAVHAVAAIHHMPTREDRRQFLSEASRVSRRGGVVLVSAWALEQPRFQDSDAPDRFVPWRRADGSTVERFYHLFRDGELPSLASDSELAVERAWREGNNHVLLAAKR